MQLTPDLNPAQSPTRQILIDHLIDGLLLNAEAQLLVSCQTDHEADLCYVLICDDWTLCSSFDSGVSQSKLQAILFAERPRTQDEFNAIRHRLFGQYEFDVLDLGDKLPGLST